MIFDELHHVLQNFVPVEFLRSLKQLSGNIRTIEDECKVSNSSIECMEQSNFEITRDIFKKHGIEDVNAEEFSIEHKKTETLRARKKVYKSDEKDYE